MSNSSAGGFLMFLMFAELGAIVFLFRRDLPQLTAPGDEGSEEPRQDSETSDPPFDVVILSRRQG
jgi:hypothetical protein